MIQLLETDGSKTARNKYEQAVDNSTMSLKDGESAPDVLAVPMSSGSYELAAGLFVLDRHDCLRQQVGVVGRFLAR